MSGFRVRTYIAEGEDPHITRTTLIKNLETLIDAVMTILSLGIESEDGTTRLKILRQLFRNGTDLIRDHCRQHRSKIQDPATFKMMADMVDDDLGRWSSAWFTRALAFQKQHQIPPEIKFMPPVIGPQWTIIVDYIAGGRLRNVTARSTHSIKSPTKRPRPEKSGAAGDNYCFLDDIPGGCPRRICPWEHTKTKQPPRQQRGRQHGRWTCPEPRCGKRRPRGYFWWRFRPGRPRERRQQPFRRRGRRRRRQ